MAPRVRSWIGLDLGLGFCVNYSVVTRVMAMARVRAKVILWGLGPVRVMARVIFNYSVLNYFIAALGPARVSLRVCLTTASVS